MSPSPVRSPDLERLEELRDQRRVLKARGWGETPGLDWSIKLLERKLAGEPLLAEKTTSETRKAGTQQ